MAAARHTFFFAAFLILFFNSGRGSEKTQEGLILNLFRAPRGTLLRCEVLFPLYNPYSPCSGSAKVFGCCLDLTVDCLFQLRSETQDLARPRHALLAVIL